MSNGSGGLVSGLNNPLSQGVDVQRVNSHIIPSIQNTNQYYVFSQPSLINSMFSSPPGNGRLFYSVVDMTLNGGMGDVVPGMKKIQLDSLLVDRATVVKGGGCNNWIVVMRSDTPVMHAFEVTAAGINPNPVVSPISWQIAPGISANPTFLGSTYYVGQMLASPDNKKLALTLAGGAANSNLTLFYGGGFMIFDFDNITGVVSNQATVVPAGVGFFALFGDVVSDVCFSPDNTKLYASRGSLFFGGGLDQYDITSGNAATILASKFVLNNTRIGWNNGMRLGPDDKIYISGIRDGVANNMAATLHRIDNPNLSGAAAGLVLDAIVLPQGYSCSNGLGEATVDRPIQNSTFTAHPEQYLCAESPLVTLTVPYNSLYSYQWNDGLDTNERTITQPGTYWVKYGNNCENRADTFHILPLNLTPQFGPRDTTICGDIDPPMQLHLNVIPGASYLWQDGSTNPNYTINDPGTYYVTITKAQCMGSDTITVNAFDVYQDLGNDTVVCEKTPFQITLEARVPQGATALWSTGATSDSIHVTNPGTYTVTVSQDICSSTDSVTISTEMCDCVTFMPNAFSPNGDGLNDVFAPQFETGCDITGYSLQVFNRYGQMIFETIKAGAGWDGTAKGIAADPGTYMFTISYDKGTQHHRYIHKGDVTLIR